MDGLLYVKKPKDWTSFDVVAKIRKIYGIQSVGHTGTLDPMATGVLIVMLGKACKANPYLVHDTKEYIARIKLGEKTDTGDCWGKVIEQKPVPRIHFEQVAAVLNSMLGRQTQIPPIYSAIKKDGKKLYEYARKQQVVAIDERQIELFELELLEADQEVCFRVVCSSGTYIRTLAEDIAARLGTVGTLCCLSRTRVGEVRLEQCLDMEEIEKNHPEPFSLYDALTDRYPAIEVNEETEQAIRNGKKISLNAVFQLGVAVRNHKVIAMLERAETGLYRNKRGLW